MVIWMWNHSLTQGTNEVRYLFVLVDRSKQGFSFRACTHHFIYVPGPIVMIFPWMFHITRPCNVCIQFFSFNIFNPFKIIYGGHIFSICCYKTKKKKHCNWVGCIMVLSVGVLSLLHKLAYHGTWFLVSRTYTQGLWLDYFRIIHYYK